MAKSWPDQTIDNIKKDKHWYALCLDFAQELVRNNDFRTTKMNRMYQGYNGIVAPRSVKYLTETYGFKNRNKYIDYRIGKTKIDILHGEFLKIPLKSTVRTINNDAVTEKIDQADFNRGAAYAKNDIEKLRSVGVDPLEGMQPEDPNDPEFEKKIKPKDRYEIIMQRIINAMIEELGMVEKLGMNFLDGEIVSRMFGQIVVDEKTGEIDFESIDPRDGIWFEFDRDPFLKKSFLKGRRKVMSINEILMKFELNDNEREKLKGVKNDFNTYLNNPDYKGKYSVVNGDYCAEVIHIEWLGMEKKYTKKSPLTKSQMEFNNSEDGFMTLDIFSDGYENNKDSANKKAKQNGQEIITEFTQELYEATRIGHCIDTKCRIKPLQMKDVDTGVPSSSYSGCVVKSVDGESISLQEVIENFSSLFNTIMYQINREISKMKGKVLGFDRGMLPKNVNIKKLLYRMLNDSLFDYSSAGITNMAGKDMNIHQMLQEFDLGLSDSFPQLIAFKDDILRMLDYMTGINNERTGNIQASSTVTNAQSALEASRTITEALFYYTHKYSEEVLMKLAETVKVVWGLHKPEKLRSILGNDDFAYIEADSEIASRKYGVYLTNGRKESQLMQEIFQMAEYYANSKELRFPDLVQIKMSDSLAEVKNFAVNGWKEVQSVRQQEQDKGLMAQNENAKIASQTQIAIARENREDSQRNEKDNIILQGQVDMAVNTTDAKNLSVLKQQEIEAEQMATQQGGQNPPQ